jgi:PAS domain S-box-containing protein
MPSVELVWGLITVIAILAILSVSIIAGVIIHSRKIKESENKFRLLFNRVNDALIVFDRNEQIVNINESTCRLLGYSQKQLLDLNLKDIILKEKWLELHDEFEKIFESEREYLGESRLIDIGGNPIFVEVISVNIRLNGDIYVLSSFRDITQRKKNEQELKRKHIALKEVLTHIEGERLKIKRQVSKTIEQIIMPALNKLVNDGNSTNKAYLDVLKNTLNDLSSDSVSILETYDKLSPREIEICNLIKTGATSKEIADTLNISVLTVNKHRERIRRKLVISNKNINLTSYLKKI